MIMHNGPLHFLRAFGTDLRAHQRTLALSYGLALVAAAAAVLAPWPLKLLIDNVLSHRPPPAVLAPWWNVLSADAMIVGLATLSVLITMMGSLASTWAKVADARVGERLNLSLRDRVLAHLQTLPPTLRGTHRSGELVLRLVDDVKLFVRLLAKTLPVLARLGITSAVTFGAMCWIAPSLGLLGGMLALVLSAIARRYGRPLYDASRRKRQHEGEVAGLAQEIVRGLASLQARGEQDVARTRFGDTNSRSLEAGLREMRVEVRMERALQIAQGVAVALVTGGGALLVLRGHLTLGALTMVVSYVTQLLKPVEKINELASALSKGMASGERLLALLEHAPAVRDLPGAVDCGRARGVVALRDVWFRYPDRPTPVLRGIDLVLEPGRLTVLVGPSGAGKSTLISLLLRLFEPMRGQVLLDGQPLERFTLRSLRAQFAVVTQDIHLFAGSLRAVLCPPGEDVSEARLWEALQRVGLDGFVRRLPDGLETTLGEDAVDVSGGQRQRLTLARAFLLDRPVLVLDEPLTGIDQVNARRILDALDRVREGRTCLVITHGSWLLSRADVVVHLADGKIAGGAEWSARPSQGWR